MEKKHIFDKPENVKRLLWIFYAICAGLFLIDAVFHRHVIHAWENLFGFYSVFGFVACVVLVLVAKEMRKVLMRKDNYYDDDR
ncbi:MAG: hypothetical protein OEU09_05265 [Rhodospirillales bacterium]|nr:hypothetical protein [Rhodospirillales bacterium]MDH3790728.1 hypothetical protein [Rhodospirillales bacterium]MDH3910687.1 hypothetical protein [Rhodospirillales bacterium]MDH3920092.1 hypothetical protein [Rhodospirillales bacterium]MDH3968739.1 hypothetical protein [Rhodospirillales bacterium]